MGTAKGIKLRPIPCIACEGTGQSSKGYKCVPCGGTGRQNIYRCSTCRMFTHKPERTPTLSGGYGDPS